MSDNHALSKTLIKAVDLLSQVNKTGFVFIPSASLQAWLLAKKPEALSDWVTFSESWSDMPIDPYMADGGRYRRRRHATFSASAEGLIKLEQHQAHYQSVDYNNLNGGIARHFEPIPDAATNSQTMHSILRFCHMTFNALKPSQDWHVETHQIRIEASSNENGKPTPEGIHRDGVDFVFVMMVKRENISSGTTTMHDLEQKNLDSFTLTEPLDCALVDDSRCMHGVTPIDPIDPSSPAYRDVMVITFKAKQANPN